MGLGQCGVCVEDLRALERLLVHGGVKGEREAVLAMEAGGRPVR